MKFDLQMFAEAMKESVAGKQLVLILFSELQKIQKKKECYVQLHSQQKTNET